MGEQIQVSVVCNAYNHEGYIRDALDSFLMQKTDFAYEILVHDDASTDHTADIIREYEAKYPELVKPIYQTENQYSKGVQIALEIQIPRAQGKYLAFCEGDDYWTDPLKLQKQFDALEAHPEVDMCAHAGMKVQADTKQVLEAVAPRGEDCVISVEDVILGEGGFVVTNSLMYRASMERDIPRFRKNFNLDYAMQIHGALRGGLLYLADCMSAYRYMSVGSWTSRQQASRQRRELLLQQRQTMLAELNEDTDRAYEKAIEERALKNEFQFRCDEKQFRKALDRKYRSIHKENGVISYGKLCVKALFPFLDGITQPFRRNGG